MNHSLQRLPWKGNVKRWHCGSALPQNGPIPSRFKDHSGDMKSHANQSSKISQKAPETKPSLFKADTLNFFESRTAAIFLMIIAAC